MVVPAISSVQIAVLGSIFIRGLQDGESQGRFSRSTPEAPPLQPVVFTGPLGILGILAKFEGIKTHYWGRCVVEEKGENRAEVQSLQS